MALFLALSDSVTVAEMSRGAEEKGASDIIDEDVDE